MTTSTKQLHLLFRDEEYFVQALENERGRTRIVVFMRGRDTPQYPGTDGASLGMEGTPWLADLAFGDEAPGDWEPALVHENGEEEIVPGTALRDPTALKKVLRAFLDQGKPRVRPGLRPYYGLVAEERPAFRVTRTHQSGLALLLYSSAELAEESRSDPRQRVEKIDDLENYLLERAREGWVGAILDEEQPIYFFVDQNGQMLYVRLALEDDGEEVVPMVLGAKGDWYAYEGEFQMDLFENQEAADRLMVRFLGERPFVGFEPGVRFYRLPGDGTLEMGSEGDTARTLPLFLDSEAGRAFLEQNGHAPGEKVEVDDVHALVGRAQAEDVRVVLHPGEHRSVRANVWVNGDDVILDTYSGFWAVDRSNACTRIE